MIHAGRKQLMYAPLTRAVSCALALGVLAGAAPAATTAPQQGYLSSQGDTVVRSGTGLCWRSGNEPSRSEQGQCEPVQKQAVAPAPVIAAPPPEVPAAPPVAPVAVTPPAPMAPPPPAVAPAPVLARITLNADALFDFDKSSLRPAGSDSLDVFVLQLKDMKPGMISVVGHTDRIGTDRYNQLLSERRAETVRAYLVTKGVAAEGLRAEGRGRAEPVTKTGDCPGARSKAVISCLQPDRRVEIEVRGRANPS